MLKEEFIELISRKMKLVRIEQGFSQEKTSEILGISKKTLVQIEKGRVLANWTTVVAFCTLFNHSELLSSVLGDDPIYFVQLIGNQDIGLPKERTLGGKVWWREADKKGSFVLQQNLISQHYRILDEHHYRWFSTFDKEEAIKRLKELSLSGEGE